MPSRWTSGEITYASIGELHRMPKPPHAVKQTLAAVLLLLGYSPTQVHSYEFILKELKNRRALLDKLAAFDASTLPVTLAASVKEILMPFDADGIAKTSLACRPFFVWATIAAEEVEASGKAEA